MTISRKFIEVPFQRIVQILDKTPLKTPVFLDSLLIILYFFQLISYFFKIANLDSPSFSFHTIRGIFYYMNPSNFLNFLECRLFSQVIYAISNILIYLPFAIFSYFFIFFQIKRQSVFQNHVAV